MTDFYVSVPLDPEGYFWANPEGVDPEKNPEGYRRTIRLEGHSYKKWLAQYDRNDSVTVPGYDALAKEPALFRIFAALDPTEESILSFANEFGDIAVPSFYDTLSIPSTLEGWRNSIEKIRRCAAYADANFPPKPKRARLRQGAAAGPFVANLLKCMSVRLGINDETGLITLSARATSLMDAMKLQLAIAVIEGRSYGVCGICQKPFEMSHKLNRNDRVFCSPKCRVKSYQRRRRLAVSLKREGRSLREIARETDSKLSAVRGWIEADRSKKED